MLGELGVDSALGMQGLSLGQGRSSETQLLLGKNPASGPSSPTPQSHSSTEDERLRRARVGAVAAEWNEGFFEPRGLGVTIQFTDPTYPTSPRSPSSVEQRRRTSNVLQKAPPPKSEEALLHQAITKGSKSKVREALEQGDGLEALNKKGETPLFRAVSKGEKAIAQILLDKGANPATHPLGEYSPLQYAASRDKKSILKLLVEKCNKDEIEEITPAGETALYLAVQKRYNSCIELLLEHGANLNARPIAKESMLNVAVSGSQTSIVKILLEKGAYVEERNKDGDTPLGRAVSKGETKIVKLLIEHGASVVARTGKGEAPLSVAVARGDTSIVTLLLARKDIDVEVRSLKGETPLYKGKLYSEIESLPSPTRLDTSTMLTKPPLTLKFLSHFTRRHLDHTTSTTERSESRKAPSGWREYSQFGRFQGQHVTNVFTVGAWSRPGGAE
jgi:ankyrin repeat protein